MKELFTLSFPLGSDKMTTVRLATGGACALVGLNLDDSEDCKVCVTESLLVLMHRGYTAARVIFGEENGLCVRVEGEGEGVQDASEADEISFALLGALNDSVQTQERDGKLAGITFRFGLKE